MIDEFFDGDAFEFAQSFVDVAFDVVGGGAGVAVGGAEGFLDDFVDDADLLEVFAGEFEGLGGIGGIFAALPQNAAAPFGRDDGVPGVLHHGEAVAHADAQGAAGAAFADDDADDGDFEAGHFAEVDGDGFGDAAFFGADAGVGAGGIDEGDDGEVEFFGELHFGEGLAVAFGVGAAEVAGDFFLGVAALVVADEHDLVAADAADAGDDGFVIAEGAVAVEFVEVFDDHVDVVAGLRARGVAGDLDGFPCGEVLVGFFEEGGEGIAQGIYFRGKVGALGFLGADEFIDLAFHRKDGFFEFEGHRCRR